jgi:hypothetical protein
VKCRLGQPIFSCQVLKAVEEMPPAVGQSFEVMRHQGNRNNWVNNAIMLG